MKFKLKTEVVKIENFKELILEAVKSAKKGDTVLFSPAFASFGMFKNEFDRGEQFNSVVNALA